MLEYMVNFLEESKQISSQDDGIQSLEGVRACIQMLQSKALEIRSLKKDKNFKILDWADNSLFKDLPAILNKMQEMMGWLLDYDSKIEEIVPVYKSIYFIVRKANAPPFKYTPAAFLKLANEFLDYCNTTNINLQNEKSQLENRTNQQYKQLQLQNQKHAHTFIAMERQCERRIALLKEFYNQLGENDE